LSSLRRTIRSDLENVFWPNVFVGASFQILEILKYSSGLKRGPAATLNQNPIFEMASSTPPSAKFARLEFDHFTKPSTVQIFRLTLKNVACANFDLEIPVILINGKTGQRTHGQRVSRPISPMVQIWKPIYGNRWMKIKSNAISAVIAV
jgi:hypothetical protein